MPTWVHLESGLQFGLQNLQMTSTSSGLTRGELGEEPLRSRGCFSSLLISYVVLSLAFPSLRYYSTQRGDSLKTLTCIHRPESVVNMLNELYRFFLSLVVSS